MCSEEKREGPVSTQCSGHRNRTLEPITLRNHLVDYASSIAEPVQAHSIGINEATTDQFVDTRNHSVNSNIHALGPSRCGVIYRFPRIIPNMRPTSIWVKHHIAP